MTFEVNQKVVPNMGPHKGLIGIVSSIEANSGRHLVYFFSKVYPEWDSDECVWVQEEADVFFKTELDSYEEETLFRPLKTGDSFFVLEELQVNYNDEHLEYEALHLTVATVEYSYDKKNQPIYRAKESDTVEWMEMHMDVPYTNKFLNQINRTPFFSSPHLPEI